MPSELALSRRRFLGLVAPALGFLWPLAPRSRPAGPQDTTVGRLADPWVAGKPRSRVTDYENDPLVVGVEEKIRCTCGCNLSVYTCRTTDFTCEVSPALHREVVGLIEEGKSAEEILAAFVGRYGEAVLMAPPRRGFNWAAYVVPGAAILLAASVLSWYLKRRVGITEAAPASSSEVVGHPGDSGSGSDPELARKLAAELEKLEL